jgi:sensor histidine kinase YesM
MSGNKTRWWKRFFTSINIRTKLIGVFLLSVVIVGSVTSIPIIGYRGPLNQYDAIIKMIDNESNVMLLISEIKDTIQNNLLLSSEDAIEVLQVEYNMKKQEINETILVIDQNLATEELRESFEVPKILVKRFINTCDEIIELKRMGFASVSVLTEKLNTVRNISDYLTQSFQQFVQKDIEASAAVRKTISTTANAIMIISIVIVVFIAAVCIILGLIIVWSIIRPIEKLRSLMAMAQDGDLSVRFESKTEDEIKQLGNSFNEMIIKLNDSMNMFYQEQRSKRAAELKILQAQIKPHFLYNTLETIMAIAEEQKVDDITEIVTALTSFFRLSLSKGNTTQSIEDELEQVRSYLVIQSARYKDKFDYEIRCDQSLMTYYVLKLTLQPMVENAIYHGIKEKPGKGKITIEAWEERGVLYFAIKDNGKGIEKEKLDVLNDELNQGVNNTGYGVYNVNERIKLSFSSEYGIHYESEYGQGTTVVVRHPLITRKQVENV